MNKIYDVVIIGSGIAGMSAALYLKRSNLDILLIENNIPGGQINYTSIIENYPGFKNIDGVTFNMNVLEQLKILNVIPKYYNIKEVELDNKVKKIITDKEEILSNNVIIATGRKPKKLGLDKEEKLIGKGISWCSYCDGNLYKDKDVIVIGGGASALEESLFLANICSKVTIVNKYDKFKSDKNLLEKVLANKKIEIVYNSNTTEYIVENDKILGILVKTEEKSEKILGEGVFIYIGYEPNTLLFEDKNLEIENAYILTDNTGKTNINGVYACGDVVKKDFYQIVLAAADGVNVALNIIKNKDL